MRIFFLSLCCLLLFGCQRVDVIVTADAKDRATLNHSIRSIKRYGQNIGRVIVISKERLTDEAEWVPESRFPFSREDITQGHVKETYRGLLKLYAPFVIHGLSKHVLMMDGEAIFFRPVRFLNRWGVPLYSGEIAPIMVFSEDIVKQFHCEMQTLHRKEPWRGVLESVSEKKGVFELYFNYMRRKGGAYHIRPLQWMKSRELHLNAHGAKKMDFVIFPPEIRQSISVVMLLSESRVSLEQIRRFNSENEILVIGEKTALKEASSWMESLHLTPIEVGSLWLKKDILSLLNHVVSKYDLHDSYYIASDMMIYGNLTPNHQSKLAGSLSSIMYIRDKEALRAFIKQGLSLEEYAKRFGKEWIDPSIKGVKTSDLKVNWKKNGQGLYVPFCGNGEAILGMKVPSSLIEEFKSVGGLRSFAPYLTSWGFRSLAEWSCLSQEMTFDPSSVQEGDLVYVKGEALRYYMERIHPHIVHPYSLMMLRGDEPPVNLLKVIRSDPMIRGFYCQGKNLPLGLSSDIYATGQVEIIEDMRKMSVKREYLLSVDKMSYEHLHQLKEEKWCHRFETVSYKDYLLELKKSRFVLCPLQGAGDSRQVWEALYMGAIPVIQVLYPSPILKDLPVICVDSLETLTPEFLEIAYEERDLSHEERLFLPYWKRKFQNPHFTSCKKP